MIIGVFDSGRGGKTVADTIIEMNPGIRVIYVSDAKHCPYGEKDDETLYKLVYRIVHGLVSGGVEMVVVACNTATTRCIKRLREDFPNMPFIGTEPAVKLAAGSDAKKILVLATPGTIHSERLETLVKNNQKKDQTIDLLACPGLADTIEFNLDEDNSKIEQKLDELLKDSDKDYDAIVLGCTHYSLIKPMIQKYFPTAKLIDGNEGIARRVGAIAEEIRKKEA